MQTANIKRRTAHDFACQHPHLPSALIHRIEKAGYTISLADGEEYFLPNANGDLLLIQQGIAKIYAGWKRNRLLDWIAGPMDTVGFPELFLRRKSLLSLEPLGPVKAVLVTRDQLWSTLADAENLMYDVVKTLAMQVDFFRGRFFGMESDLARVRLAEALMGIWCKIEPVCPERLADFKAGQFAALAGIDEESCRSELSKMNDRGWIRFEDGRVVAIVKADALGQTILDDHDERLGGRVHAEP